MSLSSNTALLLVDVQQGLDDPRWGARNNPDAEQRIADLLAVWRATRRPVIHVQHLVSAASLRARGRAGPRLQGPGSTQW